MPFSDFIKTDSKPIWIRTLLLLGLSFLLTRTLLDSSFRNSALLYVLVPYLISVYIYVFIPDPVGETKLKRFLRHMLTALAVMLGTSAILFEGFLCVLMFMPIYIFFAVLAFAFSSDPDRPNNVLKVSVVPLLVFIASLEGVSKTLSFEREEVISRTHIVDATIDEIKASMAQPINLNGDRSAFLSLFPLPTEIKAGSLNEGDIHEMKFVYKRWGFTNVHEGDVHVKIVEVSNRRVRTEMIKDTSYFSKYLTVKGTQVDMQPLNDRQTEVTLTVEYRRLLDPVWYFGPMQRMAVGESADFLIENIITPKDNKKTVYASR